MISASIYGKGCCCDCDADTWEDVLHQAVAHMMEQTNRVAAFAGVSSRDWHTLAKTLGERVRYLVPASDDWWVSSANCIELHTSVGPLRVLAQKDVPPNCVLLSAQEDIDDIIAHQAWSRAFKTARPA